MKRALSLIALLAFLNLEISYAFIEASPRSGRGEETGKNTKPQPSNRPSSPNAEKNSRNTAQPVATFSHNSKSAANSTSKYSFLLSAEHEAFLDSVFASASVPPANIPVLENALGDVVQDSVVNILDLLRVRDIAIGRGPAASAYEMKEGDLNEDTTMDSVDVRMLRDVLLQKNGVPHVIDASGGEVVGNGGRTTFTIPPGAYSEVKRMCVEDYPLGQLEQDLGSSSAAWSGDGVFLAGAKLVILNPQASDSILPSGVGLREQVLGAVPDTTTNNSVFSLGTDQDGDGVPDLRLLGDLRYVGAPATSNRPITGSAQVVGEMVFESRPLVLTGYEPVRPDVVKGGWIPATAMTLESGMYIRLRGQGWSSIYTGDYLVGFTFGDSTTFAPLGGLSFTDPTTYEGINGAIIIVPPVGEATTIGVFLVNRLDASRSNTLSIQISAPQVAQGSGYKARLLASYTAVDSLLSYSFRNPAFQAVAIKAGFNSDAYLMALRVLADSISGLLPEQTEVPSAGQAVRYFENLDVQGLWASIGQKSSHQVTDGLIECLVCVHDFVIVPFMLVTCTYTVVISCAYGCLPLGLIPWVGWVLGPACALACSYYGIRLCEPIWEFAKKLVEECWTECCPKAYARTASATVPSGNAEFKLYCLHPGCHKFGGSVGASGQGGAGLQITRSLGRRVGVTGGLDSLDAFGQNLSGIIIKVKDSPIPVSQGVTDRTGKFFIPFNILSGEVSLSAYDPKTGLFDENIGSVIVGDPLNEIHTFFGAEFAPDTTVKRHTLSIGEFSQNTVSTTSPRYEYRVFVPQSAVGSKLNIGFRSDESLTYWLQDPTSKFLDRE